MESRSAGTVNSTTSWSPAQSLRSANLSPFTLLLRSLLTARPKSIHQHSSGSVNVFVTTNLTFLPAGTVRGPSNSKMYL